MIGLRLFHGRNTPDEQLDDWGQDGPVIGPLVQVHWTYGVHLKLEFANAEDAARWGLNPSFPEIRFYENLVLFHDVYYGDFVVAAWQD